MSGRPPEPQPPVDGRAADATPPNTSHWNAADTPWLDRLPGGVFQLRRDSEGRWTFPFINAQMQRIIGMSDIGLRRDARAIQAVLRPFDMAQLKVHLLQSLETGMSWKTRVQLVRPYGLCTWVEITASPQSCADTSTVWNGFVMNVDYEESRRLAMCDRYESRQRAFRAAALGVIEIDLSTQRLYFDPMAQRQHGLTSTQTELTLSQWLDLFLPEDRPSAHFALTTPLADDARASQSAVVHLKPADGAELRSIELTFTAASRGGETALPATGASNRVGVCRDVTEQQRREQSCDLSAGMLVEPEGITGWGAWGSSPRAS